MATNSGKKFAQLTLHTLMCDTGIPKQIEISRLQF